MRRDRLVGRLAIIRATCRHPDNQSANLNQQWPRSVDRRGTVLRPGLRPGRPHRPDAADVAGTAALTSELMQLRIEDVSPAWRVIIIR